MSFAVIIPARMHSTRLPNKPLMDIAGKPMVVRVAERAALSGASRVAVATDHDDIVKACTENGIEAVLTKETHPHGNRPALGSRNAHGPRGRHDRCKRPG